MHHRVPNLCNFHQTISNELSDCDEQIVPACLRALYDFEYTYTAPEENSIAIGELYLPADVVKVNVDIFGLSISLVEYTPQAYVASDLDMFFGNFSPGQVGERPILVGIDGGEFPSVILLRTSIFPQRLLRYLHNYDVAA